jgi:hypothetical protein
MSKKTVTPLPHPRMGKFDRVILSKVPFTGAALYFQFALPSSNIAAFARLEDVNANFAQGFFLSEIDASGARKNTWQFGEDSDRGKEPTEWRYSSWLPGTQKFLGEGLSWDHGNRRADRAIELWCFAFQKGILFRLHINDSRGADADYDDKIVEVYFTATNVPLATRHIVTDAAKATVTIA